MCESTHLKLTLTLKYHLKTSPLFLFRITFQNRA